MNEWFKAFNADDSEALHAFAAAQIPDLPLDGSFRAMTGGFVVKRIRDLSPTSAEAIVKGQNSNQYARGQIDLDPKDPNHILALFFLAGPTPAEFLTPEQRMEHPLDGPKRTALSSGRAASPAGGRPARTVAPACATFPSSDFFREAF